MSQDYLLSGEQLKELIAIVDSIIDTQVTYNKDKLRMAEECIDRMILQARLFKSKLNKIKGGCCED